jgi:hypothetical protein
MKKPLWDVGDVRKQQQDNKPKEKPPKKWCPLRIEMLSKGCIGSSCEWYSDSGCAISIIAKKLK